MGELLDELDEGAQKGSRVTVHPANQRVSLPKLEHHGGVVVRIRHQRAGVPDAHLLIPFDLFEPFAEDRQIGGRFRIDDGDVVEADFFGNGQRAR